jgi:hypothetical protein
MGPWSSRQERRMQRDSRNWNTYVGNVLFTSVCFSPHVWKLCDMHPYNSYACHWIILEAFKSSVELLLFYQTNCVAAGLDMLWRWTSCQNRRKFCSKPISDNELFHSIVFSMWQLLCGVEYRVWCWEQYLEIRWKHELLRLKDLRAQDGHRRNYGPWQFTS